MLGFKSFAAAQAALVGIELMHMLRMGQMVVEEGKENLDKFKRLLLRFEHIQQRHYGMKLLAYTLINLRNFCVI